MKWRTLSFGIVLMLLFSPLTMGEVYKWVDDNGKVHYSDTPHDGVTKGIPGKTSAEKKKQQQQTEQQRRAKRDKLLRAFDEERRIKREKEAKQKSERQKKERECANARRRLANMQKGGVYYDLDKDGNRQYKSDAEVAKNIADWKKAVEYWCN